MIALLLSRRDWRKAVLTISKCCRVRVNLVVRTQQMVPSLSRACAGFCHVPRVPNVRFSPLECILLKDELVARISASPYAWEIVLRGRFHPPAPQTRHVGGSPRASGGRSTPRRFARSHPSPVRTRIRSRSAGIEITVPPLQQGRPASDRRSNP